MAQPRNVRLAIENANTRRLDVTVEYTLESSAAEAREEFIERIELWGDDKMFNGKDDRLLTFSNRTINPRGQESWDRCITGSVIKDMLNEDKTGKDEVYALVKIEPKHKQARKCSEIVRVKIRKNG
ncbi:hypothetical protein [Sanyastnella coralliicola]|uniref:hypothetical protein n=1 Tax=Sanyastnella coralliicola TaxID=3069118 RepID=UPI0027BACD45|nr:hypothetical protein [Longitalea sp. SCSIO 12813]